MTTKVAETLRAGVRGGSNEIVTHVELGKDKYLFGYNTFLLDLGGSLRMGSVWQGEEGSAILLDGTLGVRMTLGWCYIMCIITAARGILIYIYSP